MITRSLGDAASAYPEFNLTGLSSEPEMALYNIPDTAQDVVLLGLTDGVTDNMTEQKIANVVGQVKANWGTDEFLPELIQKILLEALREYASDDLTLLSVPVMLRGEMCSNATKYIYVVEDGHAGCFEAPGSPLTADVVAQHFERCLLEKAEALSAAKAGVKNILDRFMSGLFGASSGASEVSVPTASAILSPHPEEGNDMCKKAFK
jgi:hypothetical protein